MDQILERVACHEFYCFLNGYSGYNQIEITMPWFANIVNFLVSGQLLAHWSTQDKRKFLNEVKNFYWVNPYLFKYCPDQIF